MASAVAFTTGALGSSAEAVVIRRMGTTAATIQAICFFIVNRLVSRNFMASQCLTILIKPSLLKKKIFHHFAMNISETVIAALKAVGEFLMVKAKKMHPSSL